MDVNAQLREARRLRAAALDAAGFYPSTVVFDLLVTTTNALPYAGKAGERRYWRLNLRPTPEVVFQQRIDVTADGALAAGIVTLKGAFPLSLSGYEVIRSAAGVDSPGGLVTKTYDEVSPFCQDLEAAERFWIDQFAYRFLDGGILELDAQQTEWRLKLIRSA
jgi:hypothetical protein